MRKAEPHQRINYFEIAKDVGVDAIPLLAELVHDSDWEIRHHAVHAIGQLLEEHRAPPDALIPFTADTHDSVRHLSSLYLARLNSSVSIAVPILLGDLRECRNSKDNSDYDEECTRIEIVFALGHVAPAMKEVIEEVTKSLDDPSLNVRLAAAESLSKFGQSAVDSTPHLRSLLRADYDDPPELTDDASRKAWTWKVYQLKSAAVEALFKIGKECHDDVLADILRDQNALCFAHHRALSILSTLPYSDQTRQVISVFAAESKDHVALELSRSALLRDSW
nr:HEAT repeat domain-containing protein [Rhodopirellula sallentina]